jgi:hypothetical protein
MIPSSYRTTLHKKLAGIQNKSAGSKREHTRCVGYSNEAYDVFDRALTLLLEEHRATTQWGHAGQAISEIARRESLLLTDSKLRLQDGFKFFI